MAKTKRFPNSLTEAIRYFADPDTSLTFLASLRWPKGVTCPACDGKDPGFLKTRRIWKCRECGRQFSVKLGTIFEDSPIGLDKWLPALWMLANSKNGISSYELARALGVTQKTGWFMLHRIRLAMQTRTWAKMRGAVEADETFIGGRGKLPKVYQHEMINHAKEYVRGQVHTNSLENFWSLFKRAIKGTYVSVDPFHLASYVDEQVRRFNERTSNDRARFVSVLADIVGRRLTYRDLIGANLSPATTQG